MRKVIAAPIVAGLIGFAALAAPLAAQASTSPTTTSTFAITGGDLTITAPADSGSLGAYTAGGSTRVISNQIGTVTVTDNRADLAGSWTASVVSSDFTTGTTPSAAQTVPAADITYTPGSTFNPVNPGTSPATYQAGTAGALDNSTPLTAMSTSNEVGVGGVSWNPTLDVNLPPQVVSGTYSGTITHSVA